MPAASRRSTRTLLERDQTLPGFRGEKRRRKCVSSSRFSLLSIQPKQSASSTVSV
jgi:hypothetical protein